MSEGGRIFYPSFHKEIRFATTIYLPDYEDLIDENNNLTTPQLGSNIPTTDLNEKGVSIAYPQIPHNEIQKSSCGNKGRRHMMEVGWIHSHNFDLNEN
jgi:hypothetical protein